MLSKESELVYQNHETERDSTDIKSLAQSDLAAETHSWTQKPGDSTLAQCLIHRTSTGMAELQKRLDHVLLTNHFFS